MTKEWNEEDLPPVGCQCMYNSSPNKGEELLEEIKIVAHDNGNAVFYVVNEPGYRDYFSNNEGFYPIKSKQAREHEEAVNKMLAFLLTIDPKALTSRSDFCHKLIDGGYRNNGEEISYDDLHTFVKQRELAINPTAELIKNFKIYPRDP